MPDVPPRLSLLRVCVVEQRVAIGVIHHFISNFGETSKHDALRLAAVKHIMIQESCKTMAKPGFTCQEVLRVLHTDRDAH